MRAVSVLLISTLCLLLHGVGAVGVTVKEDGDYQPTSLISPFPFGNPFEDYAQPNQVHFNVNPADARSLPTHTPPMGMQGVFRGYNPPMPGNDYDVNRVGRPSPAYGGSFGVGVVDLMDTWAAFLETDSTQQRRQHRTQQTRRHTTVQRNQQKHTAAVATYSSAGNAQHRAPLVARTQRELDLQAQLSKPVRAQHHHQHFPSLPASSSPSRTDPLSPLSTAQLMRFRGEVRGKMQAKARSKHRAAVRRRTHHTVGHRIATTKDELRQHREQLKSRGRAHARGSTQHSAREKTRVPLELLGPDIEIDEPQNKKKSAEESTMLIPHITLGMTKEKKYISVYDPKSVNFPFAPKLMMWTDDALRFERDNVINQRPQLWMPKYTNADVGENPSSLTTSSIYQPGPGWGY